MKTLHGLLVALDLLMGVKDVVEVCCTVTMPGGIVTTIDSATVSGISGESTQSSENAVTSELGFN